MALQRPPIPQAPLVDPQTGYVTREWWRWFASIGVVVSDQAGTITTIKETVDSGGTVDVPLPPILDDPVNTADIVRQSLALRSPPDPLPSDQVVMMALMLQLLRN